MKRNLKKAVALFLTTTMIGSAMIGVQTSVAAPVQTEKPIYLDYENYSFAERAADMTARMTAAQKGSQMVSSKATAIAPGNDAAGTIGTGMRTYAWWNESLHGYSSNGANDTQNPATVNNATSYPITYSMGQTWDPELMYRVSSEISDEIREKAPGLDTNLNFYSPTVNLSRDPRWGRNTESFGEDPVAAAKMASQFINGFEGYEMDGKTTIDPNGYYKANATIKHYFANNSEFNRMQGVSNMTEQEAREYYSAVFRNVVKWSQPASVMASYNRIQFADPAYSEFKEMPGGINHYTLDTMLRQTFGFQGYVTGDCNSANLPTSGNGARDTSPTQGANGYGNMGHGWRTPSYTWYGEDGVTANAGTATISRPMNVAWAVLGGAELECNQGVTTGKTYAENLPDNENPVVTPLGAYTDNALDVAVSELLEARLRVGEWDGKADYAANPSAAETSPVTWYDAAKERIASYGVDLPSATGSITSNGAPTMTDERLALSAEAAENAVVLLKNDEVEDVNGGKALLPINVPADGDFTVSVYGTEVRSGGMWGQPVTISSLRNSVVLGLYSANNGNSGKQINPLQGITTAIQEKNPDAVVRDGGATADAAAADDDYVVVVVGDIATANIAAEQFDRVNNALTDADIALVKGLYAQNKKLIVVMMTAGPIGEADGNDNLFANMPSLLYSAYLGDRPGTAIGNLIVGNANPSARTAGTWYPNSSAVQANETNPTASLNQIKSYRLSPGVDGPWQSPYGDELRPEQPYTFAGNNRGRTYMYYNGTGDQAVRFPLGYGLSYTKFAYSEPEVFVNGVKQADGTVSVNPNDTVEYAFTVTNTGDIAGSDVAQLYVKTPADVVAMSSTASYGQAYAVKRLKDFVKTDELAPGASERVTLSVEIPDLAFYSNADKKFELVQNADNYELQISRSSADIGAYNGQAFGSMLSREMVINDAENWDPAISVVSFKPNTPADVEAEIPERLLYAVGDVVLPHPTVSMANDELFGYINRMYSNGEESMYPIPENITVTYTSNRPSVVGVSANGTIRAIAGGVATITGTAYDSITDTSAEAEFVVYVQGEQADHSTTIDSFTFAGETFTAAAGDNEYDISVPADKSVVEAAEFTVANLVPTDPDKVDVSIEFTPADGSVKQGEPLKAVVTVSSKEIENYETAYTFWFGHQEIIDIGNVDYMGLYSSAVVRFPDGESSYQVVQAFYGEDDKLVNVNIAQFDPIEGATEPTTITAWIDEFDRTGLTTKVFVWDGNFVPLAPAYTE